MDKEFNNGLVCGYALAKGVINKSKDETTLDTTEQNESDTETTTVDSNE